MQPHCGAAYLEPDEDEVNMSQDPQSAPEPAHGVTPARGGSRVEPAGQKAAHRARHELSAGGSWRQRRIRPPEALRGGRSRVLFGMLAIVLCLILGVAIVTQARQTESGDSLETARPAELLILLDSLRQREAALNTEVSELQNTLNSLQTSGSNNQAAVENARAKLTALSILAGMVSVTGPGVTVKIDDPGPGVSPEVVLDVLNELRAAGAEAAEINDGHQFVRVGVDTWILGMPGSLTVDTKTLSPPYSILAIGDPPTLAAAMRIPGGAEDSVKRVGGRMSVQQADRLDVTTLRQPKPHQYAQPVK